MKRIVTGLLLAVTVLLLVSTVAFADVPPCYYVGGTYGYTEYGVGCNLCVPGGNPDRIYYYYYQDYMCQDGLHTQITYGYYCGYWSLCYHP